ncbi:MAG: hypothetical protein U1E87_01485 [Alphaproteobacteria bacterium]
MDNSFLAFALLIGAQLVFIVSTRQWPLGARSVIWLLGAVLLGGSAWLSFRGGGHDNLLRAAIDAVKEREDSVMWQAVEGNRDFIVAYVAPMLDLFIAFSVVAGLLALLAFTPGEGLERIVRGLCDAILGAIVGGLIALVVVAVGFGGYPQRQVLFDIMNAAGVVDGDTIRLGDVSIRLDGIDAPEIDQVCFAGAAKVDCGAAARDTLARLPSKAASPSALLLDAGVARRLGLAGRALHGACRFEHALRSRLPHGARRLCDRARDERAPRSNLRHRDRRGGQRGRGIWTSCLLKPRVWRQQRRARGAYRLERHGLERGRCRRCDQVREGAEGQREVARVLASLSSRARCGVRCRYADTGSGPAA